MGKRDPKNTTMTVSLPKDMLNDIDAYCRELDMTRAQYIRRLIKTDSHKIIPITHAEQRKVAEDGPEYTTK